jgi:AAA domain
MTTLSQQQKFAELSHYGCEATEIILALGDDEGRELWDSDASYKKAKAELLAVWIAALRSCGRFGPEGTHLLMEVMGSHAEWTEGEFKSAAKTAESIRTPWAWFESPYASGFVERSDNIANYASIFRERLENERPNSIVLPPLQGETMNLSAGVKAPRWLVPGILARGKVHMLSGSWGSSKTLFRESAMAASLLGKPFLGRDVEPLRWMILDGENSKEDVEARWLALGLSDELISKHVHFTGRETRLKLGTPDGDRRFSDAAERFNPDVIWVDSVMRCCATTISNEDATRLVDETFAPLAEDHNAAVAFSHHHTKSSGNRSTSSNAALGGTQFTGQPDLTMTLAKTQPLTMTPQPDGTTLTESRFAFRPCKSGRGAYLTVDQKESIVVARAHARIPTSAYENSPGLAAPVA